MKKLAIAKGLDLPIEMAGQAVALVGIRGSGKTNTAGVIAEELLDQGQQIVVVDPTDAWWGLRSQYPVFIFGGPHGDLPLTEADGKTLAEFVVQERVPIILSLRHLRKGAQRRLITEFCEELYHLKGQPAYRTPLTVFIDEAPQFIPQRVMGEMARLVGAVQDMILLGRSVGFGVVMISQRFATLNADVRTQADTVVVHRLPSPLDRKALNEWIEENATLDQQKEVLSSLATLKTGEAWVWAPYFDLFKRAQIRPRHTFDSSAAPKRDGAAAAGPKDLKAIDLEKLKGKLSAAIEKAKADDPKELKKQLAEAHRMLLRQSTSIGELQTAKRVEVADRKPQKVEVHVLKDGQLARAEALVAKLEKYAEDLTARGVSIAATFESFSLQVRDQASAIAGAIKLTRQPAHVETGANYAGIIHKPAQVMRPQAVTRTAPSSTRQVAPADGRTGVEQRILNALAELELLGVRQPAREMVAFLANYSHLNSKGLVNGLGALRTAGLIDYPTSGAVALTEAGRETAQYPDAPRSAADVQNRVISLLGGASERILRPLIDAYPGAMTREAVAAAANYGHLNSKGFVNAIGRLRSLGFIDYPDRGTVVAKPVLFLEER